MADKPEAVNQDEIEAILDSQGTAGQATPETPPPEGAPEPPSAGTDDNMLLSQDNIDAILNRADNTLPAAASTSPVSEGVSSNTGVEKGSLAQRDIEFLLDRAEEALESIQSGPDGDPPAGVAHFRLEEFAGAPASTETATRDLIRDVDLDLRIELGRTHMYLEDVLRIRKGAGVPLDKLAGDPVDVYVNGRLIARGEVLVLNDNFCVRVTELVAGVKAG